MKHKRLTIFYFLNISRLYKVWFDILKPPEEFRNEHHDVRLEKKKNAPHSNKITANDFPTFCLEMCPSLCFLPLKLKEHTTCPPV